MKSTRFQRWRRIFYAGPRGIWMRPVRRSGYQSPTLTAALWGYALVVTHLTLAGRIIFICSGLLLLYAMFSLDMPIHLLAFAVLVLFVVDMLAGLTHFPKLSIARNLPSPVTAGTTNTAEYAVTNVGARNALDLYIDTLPHPSDVQFPEGQPFLRSLGPGETVQAAATFTCRRRGRYTLSALRVDSTFPFCLWRWGCTDADRQTVLVQPAFTPLRQLTLPTGVRYQAGGIALSSQTGESMEFLGCREFRHGDDPRHIHWRSWARISQPVVKEFREEYLCRTALVVDTYRPAARVWWSKLARQEDDVLEAAISLAAAVADHLSNRDYVVDLFAAGPELYRFQGGRSLAYLENILEILACLEPHPAEPFAEISAPLIEEIAQVSSAVLILLVWNEARAQLLEEVAAAGVTVRTVLIAEEKSRPSELPDSVTVVSPRDIRNGRCDVI